MGRGVALSDNPDADGEGEEFDADGSGAGLLIDGTEAQLRSDSNGAGGSVPAGPGRAGRQQRVLALRGWQPGDV